MRKIILLVVATAALALVWWKAGGESKDAKPVIAAIKVSVASAERRDVPVSVSLAGNVVAYETVAIKSRMDSQIVDVKFKDGEAVKEGQVLFLLDDRALKARFNQLTANVEKEKAQLKNARLQYERAQELVKNNFVSQAALDAAQAEYRSQLALVNSIKAQLDNTKVELSYCTITAPISGRAGTINVTLGNNVKANDAAPLVTINQISPIRVQFAIPERYYDPVRKAMAQSTTRVKAIRKGNLEAIEGTLEYINNTIDTATGTFLARALFQNEKEALWPGMYVNVKMELGTETGALVVPAEAVQGDEGNHFVFKVKEGKAVKTAVEMRSLGESAMITKGLEEGDVVVIDGMLRLADGSAVEVFIP
jgi:RND family efflux transporter MFP subunit